MLQLFCRQSAITTIILVESPQKAFGEERQNLAGDWPNYLFIKLTTQFCYTVCCKSLLFFLSLPKPMVLLHVVLLCKDTFQIVIKLPLSVFFLCIFFQMEYGYSCKCFLLETGKMDESQLRLKNAWQLSSCCARVSMDIMIGSKQTNTRSTVKKMASIAAPEE